MHHHIALDSETFKISEQHPYPPLVCVQLAWEGGEAIYSYRCSKQELHDLMQRLLEDDTIILHSLNAQFDQIVICLAYPDLEPLVWEKCSRGLWHDPSIAERLSNLASFGNISYAPMQEGKGRRIEYRQSDLELDYLGVDRTEEKSGGVRTNYDVWADVPVQQWPAECVKYALDDARNLYKIVALQYKRFSERGTIQSVQNMIGFRTAAAFALGWATFNGMRTNPEKIKQLDQTVTFERQLDRYPALVRVENGVQMGIMTAPEPERANLRGDKNHAEGCSRKGCSCPVKRVAAKPASLSRKRLARIIIHTARWAKKTQGLDISLFLTEGGVAEVEKIKGKRHIKLDCDDPVFDSYPEFCSTSDANYPQVEMFSEEIKQYSKREEWGQIERQYLGNLFWDYGNQCSRGALDDQMALAQPHAWFDPSRVDLRPASKVRFCFEPLVKSGRTGSRSNTLYPSMNGQNADPRVRPCLVHRPHHVTLSQDIVGLELISAAWTCEKLGIQSVLAALIKAGEDAHSYLAASMVQRMVHDNTIPADFKHACDEYTMRRIDRFALYKAFLPLKKRKDDATVAFVKRWRGLAKVTGLGGFGALGKNVLQKQAYSDYGIEATVQECGDALDIWRESFPESGPLAKHVQQNMVDLAFSKVKEDGKVDAKYRMTSPLGMEVRNLAWNEISNISALQNPSAEAMLRAVFLISRACRDWTQNSILYGCYFLDFIHDEVMLDIPIFEDYDQTIARVDESARLLKLGISSIFQGFPIGVESVLMYSWDKAAKEAKDDRGRLVPADSPIPYLQTA